MSRAKAARNAVKQQGDFSPIWQKSIKSFMESIGASRADLVETDGGMWIRFYPTGSAAVGPSVEKLHGDLIVSYMGDDETGRQSFVVHEAGSANLEVLDSFSL